MEVRELLEQVRVQGRRRQGHSRSARSRRCRATPSGSRVDQGSDRRRSTSCIPEPVRDVDKPFLMAIEDVFSIKGRGTVVTGRIERGMIKVSDEVEILGFRDPKKTVVTGVEMFRKLLDEGQAGDNVGCLLRGIDKERGRARPGAVQAGHAQDAQQVRGRGVRAEEGRRRPSQAVLQQLPPAVLHAHDRRDRHDRAARRA